VLLAPGAVPCAPGAFFSRGPQKNRPSAPAHVDAPPSLRKPQQEHHLFGGNLSFCYSVPLLVWSGNFAPANIGRGAMWLSRRQSRTSRPIAGLDTGAARHRAGIEGLAAERATGIGPAAAARCVEGLAADRATGIGPGAAARHGIERFAVERLAGLAGLDAGAARHHAGIEGLAADHATGIGPGARKL